MPFIYAWYCLYTTSYYIVVKQVGCTVRLCHNFGIGSGHSNMHGMSIVLPLLFKSKKLLTVAKS